MGPQASCGRNRSGFLPDRTLHPHPLSHCNFACRHRYSASSPEAGALPEPVRILAALPRVGAEGHKVISLSGGEPLLCPGLAEVPGFVEFAVGKVVRAVRLRPLVAAGRAMGGAEAACLSADDEWRLWRTAQTLTPAYEGEVASACRSGSRDGLAD